MVTGLYNQYPRSEGYPRFAEGGLRVRGINKRSSSADKPIVTIITVVYNRKNALYACVDSVINQTYGMDCIEYLIIDGGSTDGTLDIIREYDAKGLVDYFVSEKDRGIYHAMNKGLELASGDIIAILNSDDTYDLDAVEISVDAILRENADYGFADCNMLSGTNELAYVIEGNPTMFEQGVPFSHQTLFCRKRCYDKIGGYNEAIKHSADYDFMIKLREHQLSFTEVSRKIVNGKVGGVSTQEGCYSLILRERAAIHRCHGAYIRKQIKRDIANNVIFLIDFLRTHGDKEIIVFGTGIASKKLTSSFPLPISCYIDNDPQKWDNSFEGTTIFSPRYLQGKDPDKIMIVVASLYYKEIARQLISMGYDEKVHFLNGKRLLYWLYP